LKYLQDKGAFIASIASIAWVATGYAGLGASGLVCMAPGFHASLYGTATEGQVAQWLVARIKAEDQKGSGRGQIIPDNLPSTSSGPVKAVQNCSWRFSQPEIQDAE
jgi:hypothetical protein